MIKQHFDDEDHGKLFRFINKFHGVSTEEGFTINPDEMVVSDLDDDDVADVKDKSKMKMKGVNKAKKVLDTFDNKKKHVMDSDTEYEDEADDAHPDDATVSSDKTGRISHASHASIMSESTKEENNYPEGFGNIEKWMEETGQSRTTYWKELKIARAEEAAKKATMTKVPKKSALKKSEDIDEDTIESMLSELKVKAI
jgi:hypothetical protein